MFFKILVLCLLSSIASSCRSMRGTANEPVNGSLMEVSQEKPGLKKQTASDELKIQQEHCTSIEESMNPNDTEKSVELGISRTIKNGEASPYAGYRCNPKN